MVADEGVVAAFAGAPGAPGLRSEEEVERWGVLQPGDPPKGEEVRNGVQLAAPGVLGAIVLTARCKLAQTRVTTVCPKTRDRGVQPGIPADLKGEGLSE